MVLHIARYKIVPCVYLRCYWQILDTNCPNVTYYRASQSLRSSLAQKYMPLNWNGHKMNQRKMFAFPVIRMTSSPPTLIISNNLVPHHHWRRSSRNQPTLLVEDARNDRSLAALRFAFLFINNPDMKWRPLLVVTALDEALVLRST